MRMLLVTVPAIPALLIAACAPTREGAAAAPSPSAGAAQVRDPAGRLVATASAADENGLTVRIDASGLRPGTYAVHLHAVGRCDPPDFATAGPHWNPTSHQHGRLNPRGPHLGDLPNLEVGESGRGSVEFAISSGALRRGEHALLDADGAAMVIHANPDDYRTDPTGNSGGRIACGVFG